MKKMLKMFMVMTLLVMASPSLNFMGDMKMESIDAPCKSLADLAGSRAVAYLEDAVQESLLKLHELYPNWGSELFKQLCKDLTSKANVLLHEQAVQVVDECAAFCDQELKKNIAYKQALEVIKADLQDYQQFLASVESRLNPHDEMATKRRCCAPAVNCFNIAPYIPFLPTGPVAPGNYFYAFRDITVDLLVPLLPTAIPFTNVKLSDGHWVFNGTTDFIAQVAGIYFITVSFPYKHVETGGVESQQLFLQPYLNGAAITETGVSYSVFVPATAGVATAFSTFQFGTSFVASVAVGDILTFQHYARPSGTMFLQQSLGFPEEINGSVSIVRLR